MSNKRPIYTLYRKLSTLKSKKPNNPNRKWSKYMKRNFTEEDTQMTHKQMKGCSQSLATRDMQN